MPGAALAFAVAVLRENQDARCGRKEADIVEIMLGDRNARPKPVAEDRDVELLALEKLTKVPLGEGVVADVAHAVGIVRDNVGAQSLQRRSVAMVVAAIAGKQRELVALRYEFADKFEKAEIGAAAIKVRKDF